MKAPWALRAAGALLVALPMLIATPASAQLLGGQMTNLLGNASDSALDKLSQPGAFYKDKAVRILLPGPLKKASKIMKFTDKAGITNGLVEKLNAAAGLAAKEAKPIFRSAISQITLRDAVGIVGKGDGATRYLRESSGEALQTKMRPLIASALGEVGAFDQLDKLGKSSALLGQAGLSRDGLTDSVTSQALDGIFTYMGNEEGRLRANPLGALMSATKRGN
ncbi:MAG: DUF4197 domain-containing protein [Sphingomonadaceae bacterium]